MSARFRIRTSQGQELSFATHEMFAEFVRSGDLSPDDVVYDAETKEWASAQTHPVVLQLEIEAEEEAAQAAGVKDVVAEAADALAEPEAEVVETSDGSDLGLELAPAPEAPSEEEATKAFVARLEAERAASLDFDDRPSEVDDFRIKHGDGFLEQISAPEPKQPTPRPKPRQRREPLVAAKPRKKKGGGAARRYAPFLIVGGVVLAVGVYLGSGALAPTTGEGTEPDPGPEGGTTTEPAPPTPPPLIPDTEEALRERAQERFLNRTRLLLRDLEPVPDAWLTGMYLAAPSDYPEVRDIWSSYLGTIREVRAGDEARYRNAYETALDDARVEGETRNVRMATATQEFLGTLDARVSHYDRVEALASAAIQGHDALVGAEGTIAYEPAIGGRGVSEDPVIEAVGRGPDAQALLDQVLDLVLERVHGEGGPGETANVREWVYDGLLDAVTR